MARKIHRYVLPINEVEQEVKIGKVLHVGAKPGDEEHIHVWAYNEAEETRYFRIYADGQEIPDDAQYINSAVIGKYTWHLYERLA
jgi:hypothetical protein